MKPKPRSSSVLCGQFHTNFCFYGAYPRSFPCSPLPPCPFSSKRSRFSQDNLTGKGILHSSLALTVIEGLRHLKRTKPKDRVVGLPEEMLVLNPEYRADIQQGEWEGKETSAGVRPCTLAHPRSWPLAALFTSPSVSVLVCYVLCV